METVTKIVSIIMSYGGDDIRQQRQSILDFLRLKHIIGQCTVQTPRAEEIHYEVQAFHLTTGDINREVMRGIADSDILIALITELNVNVIYEMALRNLLKDELIIIVKGDYNKLVPIFLKEMAFIPYSDGDNGDVKRMIDRMAAPENPMFDLDYDTQDPPPELVDVIARDDKNFRKRLQRTLQQVEIRCPRRPEFIMELVRDLDPGKILSTWQSYYRYCVLRIKWKKKSGETSYLVEDMASPPVVCHANAGFLELFDFGSVLPDPEGPDAITMEMMINRLKHYRYVEEPDMQAFEDDQEKLAKRIIFDCRFGMPAVPLRFNAEHPQCRNETYMPCMIGRRDVVVDSKRPHRSYILVVYIRISGPTECSVDR